MLTAVEIDVRLLPKYIIAYRPGLWMYPLYGSETIMFSDVECIFDGIAMKNVNIIKSMRNGIEEMIPAYSVDECDATPNSFFYDNDFNGEKMIFFNIAENGVGHKHWLNKSLEIGVIDGFLMQEDATREEGCYYKDSLYATRVSKIPTITLKRDWLFYGKLQFNDGSVELINCDGALDGRDDIGSFVRIYAFNPGDEMEDWTLIYTGAISRTKTSEDAYTINFTDKREYVNRQIIAGKINRTTCPTVYDPATEVKEDTEFVVPVAYGEVENFPAIPIKEYVNSSGNSVVRFKFCAGAGDDIGGSIERGIAHYPYSLNKVWMESSDGDEEIILTPTAININEGWFEISADQAKSGDTDYTYETILCNYFGWHRIASADRFKNGLPHLNGAEIALDILIMFGFVQYNSANIDMQKYEEEKEKVEIDGRILSVLINEDKKTLDVISDVCYSCDCLFPVLSDGRFAIRFDTKEAAPITEITKYENFTDLTASVDRGDVVTSLILTYGQAGDSENKIEYKDKSLETVLSERWKTFKEYSKETLLADAESVAKKAAAIYDRAKSPRTESEWQVKISKEIANLDIVDAIIAPSNRSGGRAVYDIISNKKDTSGGLITVTGSKRYDIETDPNYTQGVLLGTHLYGGELCAATNYEVE